MSRFEECLPLILRHEGGYVDHPRDPGGATNLGITLGTLSAWLGKPATKAEVRALTPATVAPIYERNYWRTAGCDSLDEGVDYIAFDMAVLNGVSRTKRWLAETAGINGAAARIDLLTAKREAFYRSLSTFPTFGRGWLRRCAEVRAKAREMAS